jgi:fibro-slime domain-containing protein
MTSPRALIASFCLASFVAAGACNPSITADPNQAQGGNGAGGTGSNGAGGNGPPPIVAPPTTDAHPAAGPDAADGPTGPAPSEFTRSEAGGFKLGGPVSGDPAATGMVSETAGCTTIVGVVRDFKGLAEDPGHPDFESYEGDEPTPGLVAAQLGSDNKPVYASKCEAGAQGADCPFGQMTSSKKNFDQWYHFVDGVNKPFLIYFLFDTNAQTKLSTFDSKHFFPLDDAGWGNSGDDDEGKRHNFGFTTELHMKFKYNGGEHFTFSGDDDLWVFVNKKLAMDLGGLHPPADGTIDLDADAAKLGISAGNVYSIDLFHAERHTQASNFRVDTNLAFTDCGRVID